MKVNFMCFAFIKNGNHFKNNHKKHENNQFTLIDSLQYGIISEGYLKSKRRVNGKGFCNNVRWIKKQSFNYSESFSRVYSGFIQQFFFNPFFYMIAIIIWNFFLKINFYIYILLYVLKFQIK